MTHRYEQSVAGRPMLVDPHRWAQQSHMFAELLPIVEKVRQAGDDVDLALDVARSMGAALALPGAGATCSRWEALAQLAAADVTVGRVVEAHSDAIAVLAEAGDWASPSGWRENWTWGVFAAEDPRFQLHATNISDGWRLSGTKPWCSLAGRLDGALVTARVGEGRALFAVPLGHSSVRVEPAGNWIARGLRRLPSGPVHFDGTPASAVGEVGWYLTRPGFSWGGMGVAACWHGAASALRSQLVTTARNAERGSGLSSVMASQLGEVDVALSGARASLRLAADVIDRGDAAGAAGELLALRTRSIVASAVEVTMRAVSHALGPGPLAFDEDYARRQADLQLYVRQHHGERDWARLGQLLAQEVEETDA